MTCDQRVKSVQDRKEAVDPDDVETLEDLIVVAVNDALDESRRNVAERAWRRLTGGMRIPGFM